ncbi:ATP-binding sensor histidine kinase [Paraburkholderia sp. BL9I2N2]|uniref:trifunctional serine/threonine-protein kinase/ATP-binding protein/sensor histidine kinase n=1 Tax=Paraburkholderia sp. BL9I2N2 TaxID=1938809 RepID=UPI0010E51065|nr:ATP-binding sensor histidine kinase [Paraburkholderia sp. BL9I2N2]TCK84330.1 PAS domain S-box-containing protein [Paraburkholderia sp. BL9I2N2]
MANRLQILWDDGERVLCRGRRPGDAGGDSVLIARPAAEHPSPASLDRLVHEFGLKDELDGAWAVRPLELVREGGRTLLVLEDPGGQPLARLLGSPIELGIFLRLAVGIAAALGKLHQRGLIHKDLKPAHILSNSPDGRVRLTGFGIASRLPRERQAPELPESIAGTLAYMAPEQTGRMNRSIDSRSDLYSLGVTLYQMLTGALPFSAADPMEWVHSHIARKPVSPGERLATVPPPVSRIVMKLLAKTADERYQTAAGVERDLLRCLASWECNRHIEDFPLGEHDTPDRLRIPEKLYGREREVETLLASFDRVARSGTAELLLVSGYSGIGKSAVVNELHKVLVFPRGLFASGKFDQYKRDIPYSTLVQAFQSLVQPLLGKSDTALASWRSAFLEALEPNARLMTDLIPELKLIIGEPPSVPQLEPQHAQSRFQVVFRRFICVFARAEHPLALFLDDLQWLDAATLDLLEDLLTQTDVRHLMLIGAYRDNEVDPAHQLMHKLEGIKNAGGKVEEITLAPLGREHLGQLIAEALHCEPERAAPLTQLVDEKTAGNPFFVIQFLQTLAEEALLTFDYDAARWCWNLDRIHAKGYTDNVIDLMVGKMTRLPADTQRALQQFACLGNVAANAMLSVVLGASGNQAHASLSPAVHQELIERLENSYRFVHDRVQEVAYSLIPEASRAEVHLRIGRLLVAQTPPEKREEAIFEIVNQLNRGAALLAEQDERDQLAELNLIAGKRAKKSTAYASALIYLNAGAALLAQDCWERRRELIFALELNRAECDFLTGALTAAEERLNALSSRAVATIERASVACLLVDLFTTRGQSGRAVAVGLDYLQHVRFEWSPHPTNEDVRREYERIWSRLASRTIEDLITLPLMTDPASLATMDVLTKVGPPAFFTERNLHDLMRCWAVNLSLERGNCDSSCDAYVNLGMITGVRFGDYKAGFRLGEVGYELVERRGLKRYQGRTHMLFAAYLMPYTKHVRAAREPLSRSFRIANKEGDLIYAGYSCHNLTENLLTASDPLDEVQRVAERGLEFAQKAQFGQVIDVISSQLGFIRMLRGLTRKFGSFDDDHFDEFRVERQFRSNPDLAFAECWYWVRKLQAYFHAGDYAGALEAASRAQRHAQSGLLFAVADCHFYSALSRAASCDSAAPGERKQQPAALAAHHEQLQVWAEHCPENFEHRAALVAAEIARIEGRDWDAMRLYEQSIRSARDHGFVQIEALAYEVAARFYAMRGFEEFARAYLQRAHYCYLRWGADGKVRQLEERYPYLRAEEAAPGPTSTIGASVEHLDLATVIKISQAVSSGIVLENLTDMVMRTAIEQAGAVRGVLILPDGGEQRIAAEATAGGDTARVQLHDVPVSAAALPESVLYYVLRTRESVILDDAAAQPPFASDPYIRQHRARSILCLPLMNQARLNGALYLENNLTPHVFTPARIAVLRLVASQAAIALENAHLYRDLAQREAKIRRLVDSNIIGICISRRNGDIVEANDAFLKIVEYDREDLVAGRVRWIDLTTPGSLERTAHALVELESAGTIQPFEKDYFRKDGSRVPVLVGVAAFDEERDQLVAFVINLTERKRAEEQVREGERRYREVQSELAHANRVATMGQLAASIAHEVNQPITATVTNAAAALRWLHAQPPDVEEVRQALSRILNDGNRAGDVIGRIRELIKKAPPRKERVVINEAIREVIELTCREAAKNGVSIQTQLAGGLPFIEGDRVELQQVLLNLIVNAIEATSDVSGGVSEVLISTGADAGCVRVAVRDSGPGLAAENVERVFAPFYTTKPTGLGMGLSICRSIIEAHGGRLWASANVPCGAIFQFTVPAHSTHS